MKISKELVERVRSINLWQPSLCGQWYININNNFGVYFGGQNDTELTAHLNSHEFAGMPFEPTPEQAKSIIKIIEEMCETKEKTFERLKSSIFDIPF
jgi:hypothetical protein